MTKEISAGIFRLVFSLKLVKTGIASMKETELVQCKKEMHQEQSHVQPLLEMFIEWWLFIKTKNSIHNYSAVFFEQILCYFYLDTVRGTFDCFFFPPISGVRVTS